MARPALSDSPTKFLSKLAESKTIDQKKIDQLRILFADSKKLKPEELVKVFSNADADQIK